VCFPCEGVKKAPAGDWFCGECKRPIAKAALERQRAYNVSKKREEEQGRRAEEDKEKEKKESTLYYWSVHEIARLKQLTAGASANQLRSELFWCAVSKRLKTEFNILRSGIACSKKFTTF